MTRVQRKRTKGWRMPEGAVYIGRPSRWGNPWKEGGMAHIDPCPSDTAPVCFTTTNAMAVALFRMLAEHRLSVEPDWLEPLRGHDLACWCELDEPCHGDVLVELSA